MLALGILVGYLEGDRRAGGAALKEAGEEADGVGLAARRSQQTLRCASACELCGDRGFVEEQAGGAAVDNAADGGAVRLAPGGEPEEGAEGVHVSLPAAQGEGRVARKETSRPRGSARARAMSAGRPSETWLPCTKTASMAPRISIPSQGFVPQ